MDYKDSTAVLRIPETAIRLAPKTLCTLAILPFPPTFNFTGDVQASGSCAAADLEAALQLLHLLFVAELRWDEGRLETVLSYVEEHVRNQNKDPQERLMGMINQVNTQVGGGGGDGDGGRVGGCVDLG